MEIPINFSVELVHNRFWKLLMYIYICSYICMCICLCLRHRPVAFFLLFWKKHGFEVKGPEKLPSNTFPVFSAWRKITKTKRRKSALKQHKIQGTTRNARSFSKTTCFLPNRKNPWSFGKQHFFCEPGWYRVFFFHLYGSIWKYHFSASPVLSNPPPRKAVAKVVRKSLAHQWPLPTTSLFLNGILRTVSKGRGPESNAPNLGVS